MENNFCLKTSAIWQFVGYGLYGLKLIIPIIIIVLAIVDFVKAMAGNDDKVVTKATTVFAQRLLMGICIFFVPTGVSILLGLISEAADVKEQIEGCETCLLRPTSDDCDSIKSEAAAARKK